MNDKLDLEERGCGLIEVLSWNFLEGLRKSTEILRIACILVGIHTKQLLHTSYPSINLFSLIAYCNSC
jgi:hypothetical protein